jgi:hypothetical protein
MAGTTHPARGTLANQARTVGLGMAAGLVGGVAFGVLMQAMDMLGMVAMLVGSTSVAVGWLVHLAISAFLGGVFALLVGRAATTPARAALMGLGYGVVWWVLGALLLMPEKLGMTDMVFHVGKVQWQSLLGHVVYGLLLGVTLGIPTRPAARGR